MRRKDCSGAEVLIGCGMLTCLFVIVIALLGVCWQYSINTWLEYAGKEPCIQYWKACLISCVPGVGQLAFPVAFITWLVMMFA